MMRRQGAAHRVEVDGDTRGHNDWLGIKIGQAAGRPVDEKDADKQDNSSDCAGLGAVVATGHPLRTDRIALNHG